MWADAFLAVNLASLLHTWHVILFSLLTHVLLSCTHSQCMPAGHEIVLVADEACLCLQVCRPFLLCVLNVTLRLGVPLGRAKSSSVLSGFVQKCSLCFRNFGCFHFSHVCFAIRLLCISLPALAPQLDQQLLESVSGSGMARHSSGKSACIRSYKGLANLYKFVAGIDTFDSRRSEQMQQMTDAPDLMSQRKKPRHDLPKTRCV